MTWLSTTMIEKLYENLQLLQTVRPPHIDINFLDLKPLIRKHIFLLPLLFFFGPALASLSTWLFWLLASLLFGIMQFVYASYQFAMISVDIGALCLLKTFSTVRSQLRLRNWRRNDGTWGKKGGERGVGMNRSGWRRKTEAVADYREFMMIGIEEAIIGDDDFEHNHGVRWERMKWIRNGMGTRARKAIAAIIDWMTNWMYWIWKWVQSPQRIDSEEDSSNDRPLLSLRKIQSCVNLTPKRAIVDVKTKAKDRDKLSTGNRLLSHSISNSELHTSSSLDNSSKEVGKGKGQDNDGLEMTLSTLQTTTSRLREARLYATRGSSSNSNGKYSNNIQGANKSKKMDGESNEDETIERQQRQQHTNTNHHNIPQLDKTPSALKFLLTGLVKRNHLGTDDILIDNAKSVAECGRHNLSESARAVIGGYHAEVKKCLEWVAGSEPHSTKITATVTLPDPALEAMNTNISPDATSLISETTSTNNDYDASFAELNDRLHLLRRMRHNVGSTALMFSGGGAQAMHHLGTIKALCESGLYDSIPVISGTSGGAITAAMCAIKTSAELLRDVCVSHVATDYGLDGTMAKEGIGWFPSALDMATHWFRHGVLVDSERFRRCCLYYYGDVTFEEAYERTGKHVCITVSASRSAASASDSQQRLLLNHISTPHVTLASAVAASCALPGVMKPAKLVAKDGTGRLESFEVDGVEWIDGSVQADLPFRRISMLFNVSNYIVCQTNFHVMPFLHKAHHPNRRSLYWSAFQMCEWDIRSRALNLSRLGLFPKMFGQDISKVFKQKYHGNLTLVPRFTTMQVFGLKALVNPSVSDMKGYLQHGQIAAWPYLSVIREMLSLESVIDQCLRRLVSRVRSLRPNRYDEENFGKVEEYDDDIGSIASLTTTVDASVGKMGAYLQRSETLQRRVCQLEAENASLKRKLEGLTENTQIHKISSQTSQASTTTNMISEITTVVVGK